MSSPAQLAANLANSKSSTGPRTEEGKARASQNATKNGLFAAHDFIRPGEEPIYAELDESLRDDLAPSGPLENNLVEEIRRAMWRLRRCGQVEAGFVAVSANDPMQNEAAAKLQHSVDRARAHSHRLLHRCTSELRKLQTERHFRNEYFEPGTDISHLGLCDFRSVRKGIHQQVSASLRQHKLDEINELNSVFQETDRRVAEIPLAEPATESMTKPTRFARNAQCPCNSGQKYKRCCGKNAPPMLHAA